MVSVGELFDVFVFSVRDGYVQVSAFVAVTVLLFGLVQYRTNGALIGPIPGCGPQIVLASVYANGGIPFSALTANAISQDGDALFPLIAIDKKAAIVASIYTTIPALVVGVGLYFLWGPVLGLPAFGYGVVGT